MEKERINVAEILRNCQSGMELDCTAYKGIITLDEVTDSECYPIRIKINNNNSLNYQTLTKYGQTCQTSYHECIIFPKGKNSWEGFVPPCKFKDGHVLFVDCSDDEEDESYQYIFILSKPESYSKWHSYCFLDGCGNFNSKETYLTERIYHPRFATEEEKQKLFDAIKANGYKWNKETKTLEKLIEPIFKKGDKVRFKNGDEFGVITQIEDSFYTIKWKNTTHCWPIKKQDDWELVSDIKPKFKVGDKITNGKASFIIGHIDSEYYYEIGRNIATRLFIKNQDEWELVPNKFDINTLKPFDKVLVRCGGAAYWEPQFFSKYEPNVKLPFKCTYNNWAECIPYEANKHLCGTYNDCDDFYKNW